MSLFDYAPPKSDRERGQREGICFAMQALGLRELKITDYAIASGIAGKRLSMERTEYNKTTTFFLRDDVEIEGQLVRPSLPAR